MSRSDQPDLFGETPPQGETFAGETREYGKPFWSDEWGWIEPPPPGGHTAETIRARMLKIIAEARAAEAIPWPERRAHINQTTFPMMAEWLPKEEGEQLMLQFEAEMERLRRAA